MARVLERGSEHIEGWPEESRQAARIVIDTYGEPDEMSDTQLMWHNAGPWKRVVATKDFHSHNFPVPHIDSVTSVINYQVPPEKFTPIAQFDGSISIERTAGEVMARCHDEQANSLALNLMHDIVMEAKSVSEAREYYAKEFADFRRGKPTPYMDGLRFTPSQGPASDPDTRALSDEQLQQAAEEGQQG